MAVVAFSASPRRGGNSEILLDHVIGGIASCGIETVVIRTHEQDIAPCTGCGSCESLGRCVIDDAFAEIADLMIAGDGIVFATPLYFMNVPARGKALIDRCQAFWIARHRLGRNCSGRMNRPALLVACSGARKGPGGSDVFRGLVDTMTYVFDALFIDEFDRLFAPGLEHAGDVLNVPAILSEAHDKGRILAGRIVNAET